MIGLLNFIAGWSNGTTDYSVSAGTSVPEGHDFIVSAYVLDMDDTFVVTAVSRSGATWNRSFYDRADADAICAAVIRAGVDGTWTRTS